MNTIRRSFYYLFFTVDTLSVFLSFVFADILSRSRLPFELASGIRGISLSEIFTLSFFILVWFFYSRSSALYDEFRISQFSSQIFILSKNILAQLISGIIILFFLKDIVQSRFFLVIYLISLSLLTLFSRSFFRSVKYHLIMKGYLKKRMVVVGSGDPGHSYINAINKIAGGEYELAGIIGDFPDLKSNKNILGKLNDITTLLEKIKVDEIIVSLSDEEGHMMADVLRDLSFFPVKVRIIPEYFRFVSHKYQISFFNDIPVVDVINDPLDELHWRIMKRSFDILFSLFVLIFILSWLFPFIALLIKLNSKGPVLFKQERWGKKNRKFVLYKFRSMVEGSPDIDKDGNFIQASKDDPRVTKIGKFLRRTSLDELPQFLNVLRGNMSVVGPRPHAVPQNLESKDKIENYMQRHLVKPGITGWAQVSGFRGETKTDSQMRKRVEMDMFYIENWSFFLDLKIILMTIWKGLKGDPVAY